MELVIVNGANAISRGVIQRLAGKQYSKVKLLDFRPYRQSVYTMQRALPGVQLQKVQVQNATNLELQLEGATDVVYFTHDYLAMTSDKNSFIQTTARMAKKQGVEKLVAVCPVEADLFYTEDAQTPVQKRNEAYAKALQSNSNMTILNSDIVYGKNSYLVHYMAQCAVAGKIPKSIGSSQTYKFKPVSDEDLAAVVEASLQRFSSVSGQQLAVTGSESLSLKDILGVLERATGSPATATQSGFGLSDVIEEFFVGIAHDKNFGRFAQFFEKSGVSFTEGNGDAFEKLGLQRSQEMTQYYSANKTRRDDLVLPTFGHYKMVSLD